jgi:hypothetical protein
MITEHGFEVFEMWLHFTNTYSDMYQWICLISCNTVESYDEIDLLLFSVKWKVFQFYS